MNFTKLSLLTLVAMTSPSAAPTSLFASNATTCVLADKTLAALTEATAAWGCPRAALPAPNFLLLLPTTQALQAPTPTTALPASTTCPPAQWYMLASTSSMLDKPVVVVVETAMLLPISAKAAPEEEAPTCPPTSWYELAATSSLDEPAPTAETTPVVVEEEEEEEEIKTPPALLLLAAIKPIHVQVLAGCILAGCVGVLAVAAYIWWVVGATPRETRNNAMRLRVQVAMTLVFSLEAACWATYFGLVFSVWLGVQGVYFLGYLCVAIPAAYNWVENQVARARRAYAQACFVCGELRLAGYALVCQLLLVGVMVMISVGMLLALLPAPAAAPMVPMPEIEVAAAAAQLEEEEETEIAPAAEPQVVEEIEIVEVPAVVPRPTLRARLMKTFATRRRSSAARTARSESVAPVVVGRDRSRAVSDMMAVLFKRRASSAAAAPAAF